MLSKKLQLWQPRQSCFITLVVAVNDHINAPDPPHFGRLFGFLTYFFYPKGGWRGKRLVSRFITFFVAIDSHIDTSFSHYFWQPLGVSGRFLLMRKKRQSRSHGHWRVHLKF